MRIRDWINKGVVIGLLASIFLCVIGSAAGAFLMDREYLATDSEGIWMSVIWLLVHSLDAGLLCAVSGVNFCSMGQCRLPFCTF